MDGPWKTSADAELIDACLEGNEKAWQALVLRYKRLVYSVPVKWGLSPEDSVDIFQSVWLDCFRQLNSLRTIDGLQPWLIRVAIRKCHRLSQTTRARGESPLAEDDSKETPLVDETPASFIADLDREQILRTAVDRLPPRCQQVISSLFFEDPRPSYGVLAQRLGLSENSIGFTRERCLKNLRKILNELGYSE
jgi:RNA polymerase sigma factor (sigma-70 family)